MPKCIPRRKPGPMTEEQKQIEEAFGQPMRMERLPVKDRHELAKERKVGNAAGTGASPKARRTRQDFIRQATFVLSHAEDAEEATSLLAYYHRREAQTEDELFQINWLAESVMMRFGLAGGGPMAARPHGTGLTEDAERSIRDILVPKGEELLSQPFKTIPFTRDDEANVLPNDLEHYPHAYVIGCIMDRQMRAEQAWLVPHRFKLRLGSFEFVDLQALPLERVRALMSQPEPLHRFPEVMAENLHAAVQRIASEYEGDASNIWAGRPSSAALVRRFLEFRGVGPKIATIAANILVREFKILVSDKFSIDISPDVQVRRVFARLGLIAKDASNDELIYRARELNPTYPGVFDLSAWDIGRRWCKPKAPKCDSCYMRDCCPTAKYRTEPTGASPVSG